MKIVDSFEKFTNYVENNYDMTNRLIKLKYIHTLNVGAIMLDICEKMNLNEKDTTLAFYLALFHDLGRFKEVIRQNEFNNLKFDHGAYSNKVLFNDEFIKNFPIEKEDYLTIKKAIYFHNKKDIIGNLTEREMFFSKLLRDADRIDIFRVLSKNNEKFKFDTMPTKVVIDNFYKGISIDIKDLKESSDRVLLRFGFVKILGFNESKEVLNDLGYLDNYASNINVSKDLKEVFDKAYNNAKNFIKGDNKNGDIRKKI